MCHSLLTWPPRSPLKDAAALLPIPQQPSWVALLNQPTQALQPPPTRSFFGPLYTHLPPHFLDILQNWACSNQGRPSEAPEWSPVCALPGDEPLCCHTQAMTDNALWETLELHGLCYLPLVPSFLLTCHDLTFLHRCTATNPG